MLLALCSLSKPVPSEQRSTLLSCHITIVPSPQATASISTHWQPCSAARLNADKEFSGAKLESPRCAIIFEVNMLCSNVFDCCLV